MTNLTSHNSIVLLLVLAVVNVEAQWILDKRCDEQRRNLLGEGLMFARNDADLLGQKIKAQQKEVDKQSKFQPRQRFEQLLRDSKENETKDDKSDELWYQNLRGGQRHATPELQNNATVKQRDLFEEDPLSFMVRLYWQKGNCWQGEWIERRWCMECERGDNCQPGNILWTQFCDNSQGQKFVWIPNTKIEDSADTNYGQLKMAYFDLCLERMTINTFQLQRCDSDSSSQMLAGWHPTAAFELHPIQNFDKCINQHHHPRVEEEIVSKFCDTASKHHTNMWQVYQNDNGGNEIVRMRIPECSGDRPCSQCQGDCDGDHQCAGDLVCAQRSSDDWYMPVPGCEGIPNMGTDYCTKLEYLFAPPVPNDGLRVRADSDCSTSNPCRNPCEGDCNSDSHCFGSMKCFKRSYSDQNGEGDDVPGCVQTEFTKPDTNFCYEPDGSSSSASSRSSDRLELRSIECNEERPCFQCQGDCDANQDCYGPLECFQRDRQNPFEPVPGCDGEGEKGADYCYVPDGVRLPTPTTEQLPVTEEKEVGETTIGFVQGETVEYGPSLSDTTRTCSIHAPCLECEGDCDSDIDCATGLVCFHRRWADPLRAVPSCPGRGVVSGDYCIKA